MAELVYTRSHYPGTLAERVINIVLSLVELLLAARFVLELLGADAGATFIAWVYAASFSLVAPFQGAFPSLALSGGYVVDLSAVLAMITYAVVAWLIVRLIAFVFSSLD